MFDIVSLLAGGFCASLYTLWTEICMLVWKEEERVIWFHWWSIWIRWPLDDVFNSFLHCWRFNTAIQHCWRCAEKLSSPQKDFSPLSLDILSEMWIYLFWSFIIFYISSKFSEIKFIGLGTCKFYKDKFCNFYNLVAFHLIKFLHPRLPSYITTTHFKGYFCFPDLRRYAHTTASSSALKTFFNEFV